MHSGNGINDSATAIAMLIGGLLSLQGLMWRIAAQGTCLDSTTAAYFGSGADSSLHRGRSSLASECLTMLTSGLLGHSAQERFTPRITI